MDNRDCNASTSTVFPEHITCTCYITKAPFHSHRNAYLMDQIISRLYWMKIRYCCQIHWHNLKHIRIQIVQARQQWRDVFQIVKFFEHTSHNIPRRFKESGRLGRFDWADSSTLQQYFCCCYSFAMSWACRLTWNRSSLLVLKSWATKFNQSD